MPTARWMKGVQSDGEVRNAFRSYMLHEVIIGNIAERCCFAQGVRSLSVPAYPREPNPPELVR
ncbi:MAG: hypothetical protein KGJ23_07395 [Euryarchaeota archaeon]|nr:hypothetical protein [Euryarchaeota archaeon]MDE1836424.1 hypothetical protein [Euryarchaeota archaeon]MDE1879061.1 hypothetical protein [Euryarchaeota archaeon]MDE2044172.1 hypothetical protein [Thermoplasmata archaeon]